MCLLFFGVLVNFCTKTLEYLWLKQPHSLNLRCCRLAPCTGLVCLVLWLVLDAHLCVLIGCSQQGGSVSGRQGVCVCVYYQQACLLSSARVVQACLHGSQNVSRVFWISACIMFAGVTLSEATWPDPESLWKRITREWL